MRRHPSIPAPILATLLALLACAVGAGCNRRATPAECTAMLDRYLDLTIAAEPELADLPAPQARAAREMKRALRKSEPSYARVENQCEAEIRTSEVRCAMKAPTPETWQACIE